MTLALLQHWDHNMSGLILPRRGFLAGLGSLILAPAVVKAENLMPVANIERFYLRGIVDYNVASDQLLIRIDQANFALKMPRYVAGTIPINEVQKLLKTLGPDVREKLKPIGDTPMQRNVTMALTDWNNKIKINWNDPGPYSDWGIPK